MSFTIGMRVICPDGKVQGQVVDHLAGSIGTVGQILGGEPCIIRVDYGRDYYYHFVDELTPVS